MSNMMEQNAITSDADEKQAVQGSSQPSSQVNDSSHDTRWTDHEEKSLVRKIDTIVLSILIFCFFNFQLDRANIGNALTDNFLNDVGITQNWFNVGQQLLNAGIVLLEGSRINVPSLAKWARPFSGH
ncbi:hypothetical protein NW762_011168 [Fusarium torreyae]|uniref:Major facilitator superfamily (MFS) profile domain-containing protein n=1 Tax=Fusarium torreyae TaxID=1237075 RepID=A0A9W8RS77_9HYPO|nr:hypothetical protein NW762_011168 [Fusarium torreyae]